MKKYTLATLIAACLAMPQGALASDGTISFGGKIDNNTCVVDTNSKNLTVTLPTVSAAALAYDGATAGLTRFSLDLICQKAFSWSTGNYLAGPVLYFEADPINTDFRTGNLINTASSDAASNVQIKLNFYGEYGRMFHHKLHEDYLANIPYMPENFDPMATKYTVDLSAQYIAVGGAATPGNVSSTITYMVLYR